MKSNLGTLKDRRWVSGQLIYLWRWALIALPTLLMSFGAVEAAQDTPAPRSTNEPLLEEILVTAQKREEGLQDVPLSVQVVGGEALEKQAVVDLERLSMSLPSVAVHRSANSQRIVIRGFGSGTNRGFEQSVATFMDGVYYGQGPQIRPNFFDVARVEVLKGPQSTLFGANVTAGAFNVVSNDPTDIFEGSLKIITGVRDEYGVNSVVSGPVGENLAGRGAFYTRSYSGDIENISTGKNAREENNWGGRLVLAYAPIDKLDIRASWEHHDLSLDGSVIELVSDPSTAAAVGALIGQPAVLDHRNAGGRLEGYLGVPNGLQEDSLTLDTVSLKAVYSAGDLNFTSHTGYTGHNWDSVSDFTYAEPAVFGGHVIQDFSQISQELRINGSVTGWLDLIAGVYAHSQDLENIVITESIPLGGFYTSPSSQDSDYFAVFAQGTAYINDRLYFTAGLRYDDLNKDVHDSLVYSIPNITIFGAQAHDISDSLEENHTSWLARAEYDVADEIMVYFGASRGFKSGGFDINGFGRSVGSIPADNFSFDAEEATSYEGGIKTRLFNGNATLNTAFYHVEYDNLQVSAFEGGSFSVGNASAKVDGIDLEYRHAFSESLTIGTAIGYNDFVFTNYAGAPCNSRQRAGLAPGCDGTSQDLTGETGEFAPKFSGNVDIDWRSPLSEKMDILIGVIPTFSSSYYTQVGLDSNTLQDSYAIINARIGLASNDDQWELLLIGRNLTDEVVAVNSFNAGAFPLTYGKVPGQRRGAALQLHYNFD